MVNPNNYDNGKLTPDQGPKEQMNSRKQDCRSGKVSRQSNWLIQVPYQQMRHALVEAFLKLPHSPHIRVLAVQYTLEGVFLLVLASNILNT